MKRFGILMMVLSLLLPVLVLGEAEDDLTVEEIIEEVILDDDGNEIIVDEDTGETILLSQAEQEQLDDLTAQIETDDSVDPSTLEINPNLPDHVINILLIGVDVKGTGEKKLLSEQGQYAKRADVNMILSVNKNDGSIRLASIARNTYVEIPGRKSKSIIANSYGNAVYDSNGKYKSWNDTPSLCVRTVNHNFELNIQHYVAINFYGVASIIESLGGVDVDLTKTEAKAINAYLKKNKKAISNTYDDKNGKRDALKAETGIQHLDGIQALMYARLRSIDSDFVRTARTRHLLDCLLKPTVEKIKNKELSLFNLLTDSIDYLITDMNLSDIAHLASDVLSGGIMNRLNDAESLISEFRIPMDDTWKYATANGASVTMMTDRQKNVESLHEFIYGAYYPAN